MPPDSPEKRLGLPRSQVVEIIERGQAEAIRNLRLAGVPEQQILAAVRRIESACLTALQEQRAFYTDLKAIARQSESDPDIAQLVRERGAMYQHLVDTAVADIVRVVIQNTIKEFQNPPPPRQPVIEVTPPAPGLPRWLKDMLHTAASLFIRAVWILAFLAGLLLSWSSGGSVFLSAFGVE
jgi:hypothetical protein